MCDDKHFAKPHENMKERRLSEDEVYRFIRDEIETVPHLEALLLLWNTRPKRWTEEELSERLFIESNGVHAIMQDLGRRHLIPQSTTPDYWYESTSETADVLIEAVAETYRRELVRVSNLIHSKAPSAVRDFARAFKFTKERE